MPHNTADDGDGAHLPGGGAAAAPSAHPPSCTSSVAPPALLIDPSTVFWGNTLNNKETKEIKDAEADADADEWVECTLPQLAAVDADTPKPAAPPPQDVPLSAAEPRALPTLPTTPSQTENGLPDARLLPKEGAEETQFQADETQFQTDGVAQEAGEDEDDAFDQPLLASPPPPAAAKKQRQPNRVWSWMAKTWRKGPQQQKPDHTGSAPVMLMPETYHLAPRYSSDAADLSAAGGGATAHGRAYRHPPPYKAGPSGATGESRRRHRASPKRRNRKVKAAGPSVREGDRVVVRGYGAGTVRYVGLHVIKQRPRVGVELDNPVGKNNGTINNHTYFTCNVNCGVLVVPSKISLPGLCKTLSTSSCRSIYDANGNAIDVASGANAEGHEEQSGPQLLDAVRKSVSSLFGDYINVRASDADSSAMCIIDRSGSISSFESLSSLHSVGVTVA